MAASDENPFKAAIEAATGAEGVHVRPFEGGEVRGNLLKREQMRTVEDLRLVDPSVLAKNPRVARLTVRDLNDLAAEFSGVPTRNGRIGELTIQDMQDIEGIFLEFKVNTARELASRGVESFAVDVSCCCTTPCCCCAAADIDPVQA